MSFRAAFVPGSFNEEKRTVDLIWTTGARVLRGFFEQFYEELSLDPKHVRMDRLNAGAPLLDTHDSSGIDSIIGVVEKARLEKSRGVATVRFDTGTRGQDAMRRVGEGTLRNVSVGYRVYEMQKASESVDKIPVMRATDWEPYELTLAPMGADAGAAVRAEGTETNRCVFVSNQERAMAKEIEESTAPKTSSVDPTEALVEAAKAQRDKERFAETAATRQAVEQERAAERTRISEIMDLVRMCGFGEDLAQNLITAGTPVDKARALLMEEMANRDRERPGEGPHVRFEAGEEKGEKFVKGCVASIIERCGFTETIESAKKTRLARNFRNVSTDSGEFGGMRIPDMARYAIELRGGSTKGLHGEALIKRALETRGDAGFNTTSDFAILLETAVNRIFQGQYAMTPVTWPLWAGRKPLQDFRTSTFYRPGTFGVLDSVTEAGEVKHKNIPDGEKRTMTPATKANIIGITRRAMVNDDLGAFQNLASGLGMAAAFTVEADAYALITANSGLGILYDANALFHSSRANIGPTGAMSVATLDGASAVMAKQKDPSANIFLALQPTVWLGPVELAGTAKQFNTSTADPTDNKSSGVSNKVLNLFSTIVRSPYLSVSSATRHYLLADPGMFPVFAVGFIDGNEAPQIVTEQSFNYDGLQMKVTLDYGTAVLDYRGAVTCAGA